MFLSEGRISYYTTIQGLDILRNMNFSGYVTFYQINTIFVNVLFFSLLTKSLCGPMKWIRGP